MCFSQSHLNNLETLTINVVLPQDPTFSNSTSNKVRLLGCDYSFHSSFCCRRTINLVMRSVLVNHQIFSMDLLSMEYKESILNYTVFTRIFFQGN